MFIQKNKGKKPTKNVKSWFGFKMSNNNTFLKQEDNNKGKPLQREKMGGDGGKKKKQRQQQKKKNRRRGEKGIYFGRKKELKPKNPSITRIQSNGEAFLRKAETVCKKIE